MSTDNSQGAYASSGSRSFSPPRLESKPTIYAYADTNPQYAGLLKVGYTTVKVLVLTFKPAVEPAWEEDLKCPVDFRDWQFISPGGLSCDAADLKARYEKGEVGDVEVEKCLAPVLNVFLDPIRARREAAVKEVNVIDDILMDGTRRARAVAEETMACVREAMKIDYPFRRTV